MDKTTIIEENEEIGAHTVNAEGEQTGNRETAEPTDTNANDEDDRDRRVIVGTGLTLDKQERHDVRKAMAFDWDLRRLSLFGPVLWNVLLISGALVGAVFAFWQLLSLFGRIRGMESALAPMIASAVSTSVAIVLSHGVWIGLATLLLFPVLLLLAQYARRAFRGVRHGVGAVAEALAGGLLLFDWDVWKNVNYWHPFTAHHSDRDPLVLFSNGDDDPVAGAFTDAPYYENVFVDSLYVTVDGLDGWRERELEWFGQRIRSRRHYLMGALALVGGAFSVSALIGMSTGRMVSAAGMASNVVFLALTFAALPTHHFRFRSAFFANSAGGSDYGTLLHRDPKSLLRPDDAPYENTTVLGNSLAGYGVFYVSEYLRAVVSADRPYEYTVEADDGSASRAGEMVLAASVPGPGTTEVDDNAEPVTVQLHGVRYLERDNGYTRGRIERLRERLVGLSTGDENDENDETEDRAYMNVTGECRGVRLPVKRYMSVPFGPTATAGDNDFPLHHHREWEEDELHYLLVGGAEHQQGLVRFIQYLKDCGYENVDLVENTFAGEEDFKFSSEYFVSSVLGGPDEEVFRGEKTFLYLRHQHESGHFIHALVGLSAKATKMGSLYWRDAFPALEDLDGDVLYRIDYEAKTVDDVGDHYARPEVSADGVESLSFEWIDDPNDPANRSVPKDETRIGHRIGTMQVIDERANDERRTDDRENDATY